MHRTSRAASNVNWAISLELMDGLLQFMYADRI